MMVQCGSRNGPQAVLICSFLHMAFSLVETVSFFVREAPLLNKADKNPFEDGGASLPLTEKELEAPLEYTRASIDEVAHPEPESDTSIVDLLTDLVCQFQCWYVTCFRLLCI